MKDTASCIVSMTPEVLQYGENKVLEWVLWLYELPCQQPRACIHAALAASRPLATKSLYCCTLLHAASLGVCPHLG